MKVRKPFSLKNPTKPFVYKVKKENLSKEFQKLRDLGYIWVNNEQLIGNQELFDYNEIYLICSDFLEKKVGWNSYKSYEGYFEINF